MRKTKAEEIKEFEPKADITEPVKCGVCLQPMPPMAIVLVDDIPDDELPGKWACTQCLVGYNRRERARTEPKGLGMNDVRGQRDILLARTDWTQLPDVPPTTRAKWAPYRQTLRDIPSRPNLDPNNVAWPELPV